METNKLKDNNLEEVLITIAKNVRRLRKKAKLSQEDLAFSSDIDPSYIWQIENSRNNVSMRILCDIAKVLDVSVITLIEKN